MPKALAFKSCKYCGARIYGRRRTDRKAFHYAPRCPKCTRKALDPRVLETRRRILNAIRLVKPVGSTRIHNAGRGAFYILEKTRDGSWKYQHRLRCAALPGEEVHHADHNGLNNIPENISSLTASEHRKIHLGLKTGQWSRLHELCIDCQQ